MSKIKNREDRSNFEEGKKRTVLRRDSSQGDTVFVLAGTVGGRRRRIPKRAAAPFGAILCRLACILSMQRMQSVVTEGVVC